jgi:hypothetical protein
MLGRDPVERPPGCDTGEHSTSAAGGRDPRGGGHSAHTGVIRRRPKTPARVLFSRQHRHCPRSIPAPITGTPARGVRPVIGDAAVLAGVSVEVEGQWPVFVSTLH